MRGGAVRIFTRGNHAMETQNIPHKIEALKEAVHFFEKNVLKAAHALKEAQNQLARTQDALHVLEEVQDELDKLADVEEAYALDALEDEMIKRGEHWALPVQED